tara:strand:- start:720 stop:1031 length:312 start_codon:yes stop_codon:yes gene_type:complete
MLAHEVLSLTVEEELKGTTWKGFNLSKDYGTVIRARYYIEFQGVTEEGLKNGITAEDKKVKITDDLNNDEHQMYEWSLNDDEDEIEISLNGVVKFKAEKGMSG